MTKEKNAPHSITTTNCSSFELKQETKARKKTVHSSSTRTYGPMCNYCMEMATREESKKNEQVVQVLNKKHPAIMDSKKILKRKWV